MSKQLTLLIVDSDEDFCQLLKSYLARNSHFAPIIIAHDGQAMINMAVSRRPDAIICDLALPNIDGLSALKEILAMPQSKAPVTFLLSAFSSDYSMQTAKELGVTQFFMKPCNFPTLTEHLKRCCSDKISFKTRSPETENAYVTAFATRLLTNLRFPTHLNGYRYVRDAIVTAICRAPIAGITKTLYPEVGKLYKVGAQCVERSIRAAITVAWELQPMGLFAENLPTLYSDKKPSNGQFISAAVTAFENAESQLLKM